MCSCSKFLQAGSWIRYSNASFYGHRIVELEQQRSSGKLVLFNILDQSIGELYKHLESTGVFARTKTRIRVWNEIAYVPTAAERWDVAGKHWLRTLPQRLVDYNTTYEIREEKNTNKCNALTSRIQCIGTRMPLPHAENPIKVLYNFICTKKRIWLTFGTLTV